MRRRFVGNSGAAHHARSNQRCDSKAPDGFTVRGFCILIQSFFKPPGARSPESKPVLPITNCGRESDPSPFADASDGLVERRQKCHGAQSRTVAFSFAPLLHRLKSLQLRLSAAYRLDACLTRCMIDLEIACFSHKNSVFLKTPDRLSFLWLVESQLSQVAFPPPRHCG